MADGQKYNSKGWFQHEKKYYDYDIRNAFRKYKNVTSATVSVSVKTIGQNAFRCQKLKKLTLPGDFEIRTTETGWDEYWITGKVETVVFNTNLNLERAASFDTNNLVVKKNDPNYKSVGGVIYSKDGKEIVRVPFQRSKVVIKNGCEVFCLQSVLYANEDDGGCRVRKIVIPASVKRVESERYYAISQEGLLGRSMNGEVAGLHVEIKNRQLDDRSLSELVFVLQTGIDDLMSQLPDRISLSGDMYLADKNILFMYKGKDSELTIPAGITKIGDYVFRETRRLKKLVLPEGLTEIGKESFMSSSSDEYGYGKNTQGMTITFPSTLKKIGEDAFWCTSADVVIQGESDGISDQAFDEECTLTYTKGLEEQKVSVYLRHKKVYPSGKAKAYLYWTVLKEADGCEVMTATNAKFTKNKKKMTIAATDFFYWITLKFKGKINKKTKLYARVRPYSYLDGKKVYGRWAKSYL